MRSAKLRKVFTTIALTVAMLMLASATVFAATTYLVQDGAFTNAGFINAGEAKEGVIEGPGNWTQLNLGDAAVDAPYLHVILKATGDTAKAQIAVSDLYTFNLTDLNVTLTEEYQDVVLPVQEKGIMMLSWLNCMGLDGGSSVYTVKDVFLSDDATSTLAVAAATSEEAAPATKDAPKTGNTQTTTILAAVAMVACAGGYAVLKKYKKVLSA